MKKIFAAFFLLIFILGFHLPSFAQFTPEELAEREQWEEFLKTAEVTDQDQPFDKREAVTRPWVLTLEKDGNTRRAIWKDCEGRMGGYIEDWKREIAAYRLDKHLGIGMVPPTVEKRFRGDRGSCQLWMDNCITLKDKEENDIKTPSYKIFYWNRALYLQRLFDNLIANEDRHQNQFLIVRDEDDYKKDFRMLLIDHSRSFWTKKKHTKKLIYDENFNEGPRLMKQIPRDVYHKLKTMKAEAVKNVVGEYLTDEEIEAVLKRRDLIIKWLDKRIKKMGEDQVLY